MPISTLFHFLVGVDAVRGSGGDQDQILDVAQGSAGLVPHAGLNTELSAPYQAFSGNGELEDLQQGRPRQRNLGRSPLPRGEV